MPTFRPTPDLVMHYEVDDFTDPWRQPETILLLHGNAESGLAWYAWVPALARHYRVVRPDMRGFGQSTPMPRDYPWTLDRLIDDFCLLLDNLRIDRFHLVGAKIGGTVARAFAARRPERVKTLTVVGTPPPLRPGAAERAPELVRELEQHGVEHWALQNMGNRLACADSRADVPKIACPTLVITTEESGLATVDETRAWQQQIADSELVVLPGNSYHVAATHAAESAK